MNKAVSIQGISKHYGAVQALKSLSLDVEQGELFGLIGPDGAGKTSLFRILTTLLLPDAGKATVNGLDVVSDYRKIRQQVGYMPGRFSLYPDLTVKENITFFATLFNTTLEENYSLVRDIYVQIQPFESRKAGKLSGGMKQKLALCCALIHRPTVLFLDEPTTGVDPVSRAEFWQMLKRLKAEGISILVSTPYMDEAAQCNRIGLLKEGELLTLNTPQGIVDDFRATRTLWSVRGQAQYRLLQDLRELPFVAQCFAFGESHHVILTPEGTAKEAECKAETLRFLSERGHHEVELNHITASIEDCYMQLAAQEPLLSAPNTTPYE